MFVYGCQIFNVANWFLKRMKPARELAITGTVGSKYCCVMLPGTAPGKNSGRGQGGAEIL